MDTTQDTQSPSKTQHLRRFDTMGAIPLQRFLASVQQDLSHAVNYAITKKESDEALARARGKIALRTGKATKHPPCPRGKPQHCNVTPSVK